MLNSTIRRSAFNLYWSGWDRRDMTYSGATGIHHRALRKKRISHSIVPTVISGYFNTTGNDHHYVQWQQPAHHEPARQVRRCTAGNA